MMSKIIKSDLHLSTLRGRDGVLQNVFRYVVTQNITLSRCLASRVNANRHLVKRPLYLALAVVAPLPKYIYFMAKLNK